jgi:hypothetical protein
MTGRPRLVGLLLLGLAGCPQFQNDDWVVGNAAPETGAGDEANAPESGGGGPDSSAGDVVVRDGPGADATSSGDASQDGTVDGPSGGDTGSPLESGAPESSVPDGPAVAQKLYCNLTRPRGIALANNDVCWVGDETPRAMYCAPADGSGRPAHFDVQSDATLLQDAFDLLFDATNVYWSNGANNQVVTRPQSGGQPQQYFTGGGRISFLAAGVAGTIWASDFPDPFDANSSSSGEVIVGPSGGGTSSNAIYTGQTEAAGVAMFNGNVYWGMPNGLAFGPVTGNATITTITPPEMPVAGVAVDSAGVVYFVAGQSLYSYVTGATTVTFVYGETQPFGAGDVAVDDQHVYFSEPEAGCIMRIAK